MTAPLSSRSRTARSRFARSGGSSGGSGAAIPASLPVRFKSALCCRFVCLLAVAVVPACAQQADGALPALTGIAHVALRVSDLAKSREFYGKLGFEEAFAMDQSGTPTEAFLKINDRQFIELYPQRSTQEHPGFMHVCFESPDVAGLYRSYVARGLAPTPVARGGAGNLLFMLQGPEEQTIEYTQYMPGSRHVNDQGKHLGKNRISAQILGLGIVVRDLTAAKAFYQERLGFQAARKPLEPAFHPLQVAGSAFVQVEFVPQTPNAMFQLLFSVPNLKRTASQLKDLRLPFEIGQSVLRIRDPDGNLLVFVRSPIGKSTEK